MPGNCPKLFLLISSFKLSINSRIKDPTTVNYRGHIELEEILEMYPHLKPEDISAAIINLGQ